MDRVQAYGEAFAKIQAATGLHDIEELVATFLGAEDANFTLFNYCNQVNEEVDRLEEHAAAVR